MAAASMLPSQTHNGAGPAGIPHQTDANWQEVRERNAALLPSQIPDASL